jgi:hypothetical protein
MSQTQTEKVLILKLKIQEESFNGEFDTQGKSLAGSDKKRV